MSMNGRALWIKVNVKYWWNLFEQYMFQISCFLFWSLFTGPPTAALSPVKWPNPKPGLYQHRDAPVDKKGIWVGGQLQELKT